MVVLGGWRFLMSEVTLYTLKQVLVRGGPDQVQYAQDLIEAALNRACGSHGSHGTAFDV